MISSSEKKHFNDVIYSVSQLYYDNNQSLEVSLDLEFSDLDTATASFSFLYAITAAQVTPKIKGPIIKPTNPKIRGPDKNPKIKING